MCLNPVRGAEDALAGFVVNWWAKDGQLLLRPWGPLKRVFYFCFERKGAEKKFGRKGLHTCNDGSFIKAASCVDDLDCYISPFLKSFCLFFFSLIV